MRPAKIVLPVFALIPTISAQPNTSSSDYAGSADASQYSSLHQINRANVHKLRVAWSYPTGDGALPVQSTPSARYPLWPGEVELHRRSRRRIGQGALASPERARSHHYPRNQLLGKSGRFRSRLLFSLSNFLQEIDAHTGAVIPSFGANGRVDLRIGLGRDPKKISVQSANPGRVFENLIILGSATNSEYESAPGDIRAFDVRSGALVWTFHTIPIPESSATTPGLQTPGKPSAAPMPGPRCPLTPPGHSSTSPQRAGSRVSRLQE